MATGKPNNEFPWDEAIRRYLAGEMRPEEMHALEKAALEDPFLADALEGMSARTKDQIRFDHSELSTRLSEKVSSQIGQPAPLIHWTRIAIAASVLLLAILATVFLVNRNSENQLLSVNTSGGEKTNSRESATVSANDSTVDSAQSKTAPLSEDQVMQNAEKPKTTDTVAVLQSKQNPVSASKIRKANLDEHKETLPSGNTASVQKSVVVSAEQNNDLKTKSLEIQPVAGTVAPPQAFVRSDRANANAPGQLFYFTGQVTDTNRQPVTFANISIKNSNTLTYTDARGYFRLLAADSILHIDVKSVGFQTNSTQLFYKQPQHLLVLNAASAQKKAKSASKNKITEPADTDDEAAGAEEDSVLVSTEPAAEPVDGWGAYHIYLLNNVRLQKGIDNQLTYGNVVISFLVNSNGWLSDFRIEKSLNAASDREAIRLVKEGPKWELQNTEKPMRAKLTIHF